MIVHQRITLKARLLVSFGIVIVFGILVGAVGLYGLQSMFAVTEVIATDQMDGLYSVEEANKHRLEAELTFANLRLASSAADRQQRLSHIAESLAAMDRDLNRFKETFADAHIPASFSALVAKELDWKNLMGAEIAAACPATITFAGALTQVFCYRARLVASSILLLVRRLARATYDEAAQHDNKTGID